jgi:hypothetical protein
MLESTFRVQNGGKRIIAGSGEEEIDQIFERSQR